MRIIAISRLKAFLETEGHEDSGPRLRAWYDEAFKASWTSPAHAKEHHRLIVEIHYDEQRLFIRFVGTHEAYDKIDARTV